MTRPALALLALLSSLPPATASLSPRPDPSPFGKDLSAGAAKKLPPELPRAASARTPKEEFVVTEQTEVLLDGRPCRYQDVPAGAGIVQMEVAADNKTVLKIHFRTKK
jgi:hypothetical protein